MSDTPQKPRRGCFFYGCLSAAVLMLLLVVGMLVGLRMAKKMFFEFTDSAPAKLPVTEMPAAQLEQLKTRVHTFFDQVEKAGAPEPLTLTVDELNGLLTGDPGAAPLRDKFHVAIEGGELKAQVSLPLEQAGLAIFKGRYLNGTATIDFSLDKGTLRVSPRDILVKGKPIPGVYLRAIQKQNLAGEIENDPRAKGILGNLKSIEIKDGRLVLTPKGP